MVIEQIKLFSPEAKGERLRFLQRCYNAAEFPAGWAKAEVVGIFKKGAHHLPANFRPISLLEV
eukprot:5215159-Alexandrium_andersonii.AAC.1